MKVKMNYKNRVVNIKESVDLSLLFLTFLGYVLSLPSLYRTVMSILLLLYIVVTHPSLKFKVSAYQVWGIVVILFSLTSSLWSYRTVLTFHATFEFFKLFVFTYFMYYYCYNKSKLINVLQVFVFVNILLVVFILFYFGTSTLGEQRMSDTENGVNGNGVAISLTFALYSIFLIFQLSNVFIFKKIFYYSLSILFFVFIMFTGSRTALLMILMPLGFYFFFESKYKLVAIISFLFLLMISYVIIMNIPMFYNVLGVRVEEAFNIVSEGESAGGDTSRLLLILYGIGWFQDNPFLGIGMNNYRVLSDITPPFVGRNFYAHSNIIEMLVDVGVIGFVIYYSFIFIIFNKLKNRVKNSISSIVKSLAITIFIHDIFSMSYYEWEMHFLTCMVFILLSFIAYTKKVTGLVVQK